MSEFLAEARILVRPDTSRFRTDLEAQLKSVLARPVQIPVVPVVASGFAAAAAGTTALAAAQAEAAAATGVTAASLASAATIAAQYTGAVTLAAAATTGLTEAQIAEAAAAKAAAAAEAAHARTLKGMSQGALASGLSLAGLRGATLAASKPFLIGTAAIVAFTKSLQLAASLETELNVFKATAGATADEMARVSDEAKQLGRDITLPGVSAGTAATAMTELAKAGLSVQDSLAGARGALQLSTAAQIDVKDATTLTAGALNAFQLSGADAVKVADLLTGAAKESQGEISDMGTALGQAAAVSHLFGVSIEDTITLLTELAQAGISGGRAGTSLRVAFLRLVNPPKEAAKALKELNVQIRDQAGNLRPQIFSDITEALQGYTKAQQQATLATIFGADAVRTAAIVGNRGAAAFEQTKNAVTEVGLAQELAAARTKGLEGSVENLKNQVGALALTFGDLAKGPVTAAVNALAEMVSVTTDAAEAIIVLGKAQVQLEKAFAESIPFVDQFGKHLGSIVKVTTLLNPLTGQLKAITELSKKFGSEAETSTPKLDKYGNAIDGVGASLSALSASLVQSSADSRAFTQQVTTDVQNLLQSAADSRVDISKLGQTDPAKDRTLRTQQIENIIGGFNAEEVRAKIAGDNAALLDVLNTEQNFLERQLQRDFVRRRPALKREIENALLGTITDIASIQATAAGRAAKLKSDAEKAANDAAAAVRDREQAILSQFGIARDQRQNAIARAAQTAGLQDDINQEKKLKALVLQQIAQVKERISLEGGRVAAITALRAILTQVNGQLAQLAQQQAAARAEQRARLVQSTTLDVDLAQITGNQAAEIAARKRLITQLKAQQALVKRGTLEWKQLRNDIATQNAAIAAVTAEKKKQGQSFAAATFEFLQTQQGFASNLLGNLIPGGATGGLVGSGGGAVESALNPAAGFADAGAKTGPTAGQANATNHILNLILGQLKAINGATAAPESHAWRAWQNGVMDGVGGG